MSKSITMDHVGYGVFSYPHPDMEGWQAGRVEIGGHAQDCMHEYGYWYPPQLDRSVLEKVFELVQHSEEARRNVGRAIERVHRHHIGHSGWWQGEIYSYDKGEE